MLHEDFYASGRPLNRERGIPSGFRECESQPSRSYLERTPLYRLLHFGRTPIASSDANHVGLLLVRLYQELGLDALEKLNGWFSGLLVEQRAPLQRGNRQMGVSRIAPSRPPGLTGRALAITNHQSSIPITNH